MFPAEELSPLDPLQATFRGGAAEPLHGWYPYLEGYSPEFVKRLLVEFAPAAGRVLDPFGGVGTTALAVAQIHRPAFYCEVNPLLQFLVDTKLTVLGMDAGERQRLAGALEAEADELPGRLRNAVPDTGLETSYGETFGTSRFFDDAVFRQVLQMRTVVDQLACSDRPVGALVCVAVLAKLVIGSLLIRRGDVRFRNDRELAKERAGFVEGICEQLRWMARDLCQLGAPVSCRPLLIAEDARDLDRLPPLEIDAVVTSPPYLNGTNYFRNTKIELWFLRSLQRHSDLAAFRWRAITAGINDVTVGKPLGELPAAINELVARLAESAYDPRIPRMAAGYFSDMQRVIGGLTRHVRPGAVVLLDIGDSAYGGIHVPTPALLAEVFEAAGIGLEREITLRRRKSRNGLGLRQVLLVLRKRAEGGRRRRKRDAEAGRKGVRPLVQTPLSCPTYRKTRGSDPFSDSLARPWWQAGWRSFKKNLPHQRGDFAKRNWGHPLHSLCSYQGKMKPSLAHFLIETFVPSGGKMLDPFGGVGTIPFAAALTGRQAHLFEISPAAFSIAAAKVGEAHAEACDSVIAELEDFIGSRASVERDRKAAALLRFNGALADYYHPGTFRAILRARRFFLEHPPGTTAEFLVHACLLHLLHGNRPYALSRRSHPITPFAPTGPVEYRALLPRLRDKVSRSLAVPLPASFVPGTAHVQDATSWWPPEVRDLDAIVTSPPFFDSTRFFLANWIRLWFCGWQRDDFNSRPPAFVDERQKAGFSVYEALFRLGRARLKPGGVFVLHLGKSKKCDMARELAALAAPWFRVADVFRENVEHCESHGIRDKGTVDEHAFVVLV